MNQSPSNTLPLPAPAVNGRLPATPQPDPAIEIRGLRVARGGNEILCEIDLTVPRGLVYGLVGPSGSGKTTLIRAILGRQRIAGGTIRIVGQPAGSTKLRQLISYMPQTAAVYEDLTARENLAFFGAIDRVPSSRVTEVLRLVELDQVSNRPVATLSGGQRQRVSLAVAILAAPPLLILDEPTVGLDPRLRYRLWDQFAAWAAAGTTLLISTHVMEEASHADRLAVLMDGAIVADGTPTDLLDRTGAADLEAAVLRLTDYPPEVMVNDA